MLSTLILSAATQADPPLPGEITRIAFGSCLRQDRPAPILNAVLQAKPDVFIWLGDNIYGDSDDPAVIAAKYKQLGEIEGFNSLRAAVPFLYLWDDHDYGQNDAGVEYAFKEQNKKLMLDFFAEPQDSQRRQREGNYDARIIGPEGRRVHFILLDTRSFRSPMKSEQREKKKFYLPSEDPAATVLGEAQWAWLEAELKTPAELRLICTSIQVSNDAHRFEKWGNFPAERTRLMQLLERSIDKPYFVLSGDRHHGSMYKLSDKGTEITASSLNQGGTPSPEDLAASGLIGSFISGTNFGVLEIDWNTGTATVQLRDDRNAVVTDNSKSGSSPAKGG
jgi:alkaline phosphatase D